MSKQMNLLSEEQGTPLFSQPAERKLFAKVNDWVKIDRWPLTVEFGQVTSLTADKVTIVNYHGSRTFPADAIMETFDPIAIFADEGKPVPQFVLDRIAATS